MSGLHTSMSIAVIGNQLRIIGLMILGFLIVVGACEAAEIDADAVLKTYCIRCHGEKLQKGERRFDQLRFPIEDNDSLRLVQEMIDQLVLGAMPPTKADQPDGKTKQALIQKLRQEATRYYETKQSSGGETVLRRLNRREYRNTVRDLLKLNMQMFDPTQRFPRDQTTGHFDNVGNSLVTSGYLLEQYLIAADLVIEKALSPASKPEIQTWEFRDDFEQQPELVNAHKRAHQSKFLCIHETINSENHWGEYAPILNFQEGAPHQGRYEIRLLLEAKNKNHPHPKSRVSIDKDEPMWLGIVPGNIAFGSLHNPQPFEEVLAKIAVPDGEPQWHTSTVWLDREFTPRFIYLNGPANARGNQSRLGLALLKKDGGNNNKFGNHYIAAMLEGQLPHIRIHEIEIKGPLYDDWPPASQTAILGEEPFAPDRLKQVVTDFVTKAYRREAKPDEIQRLLKVAQRSEAQGRTPYEAMKDTLKATLCAPGFLYLNEETESVKESTLTDVAFVNRLAYFLWSSAPDEQLLSAARNHTIRNPPKLIAEVDRMLTDPRAHAFHEGFTDSWLVLRELGGMPPDRKSFAVYYEKNLRPLMRQETQLFFRHVLEENLSVRNFLDSDFTFVNKTLAQFYDLPAMQGYDFQKVSLSDKKRGGLLGQASVLTVTANGIETSPVTRGVWVLENIFGTPPSPPPDDVEPLDPDIRGAKTIREQLAKHRHVAACNECHQKIDPPGFALENFDPIGRWRTVYGKSKKVDASGEFHNGDAFQDVVGFKEILLTRHDQFTQMLIEKLLVYGTGRRMEATDRPEMDRLLAELQKKNDRLRDGLLLVIESSIFQAR